MYQTTRLFGMLVLLSFLVMGCSSSKGTAKADENVNALEVKNNNTPLDVYLKRLPGVRVVGQGDNTEVYVRGGGNISNEVEGTALFVVDNVPVGNSFSALSTIVDVNDIKSVRVLRNATDTAEYGLRGSNGVIEIKTKKKEFNE
jgi:TonB-dependent SusC/RagA subfamily outer membrane receptor